VRPRQADAAGLEVKRSKIKRWTSGGRIVKLGFVSGGGFMLAEEVVHESPEDAVEDSSVLVLSSCKKYHRMDRCTYL
jgi:hypothetical protein